MGSGDGHKFVPIILEEGVRAESLKMQTQTIDNFQLSSEIAENFRFKLKQ